MRSARAIRQEHKRVCKKLGEVNEEAKAANWQGPLPKDELLYFELNSIRMTLEWIYPSLIKTSGKGLDRKMEMAGYRHYVAGPFHATVYP